jgi:hypothetical protein
VRIRAAPPVAMTPTTERKLISQMIEERRQKSKERADQAAARIFSKASEVASRLVPRAPPPQQQQQQQPLGWSGWRGGDGGVSCPSTPAAASAEQSLALMAGAAALYATGGGDFTGSIARVQQTEARLRAAASPAQQTPMRPSVARFL